MMSIYQIFFLLALIFASIETVRAQYVREIYLPSFRTYSASGYQISTKNTEYLTGLQSKPQALALVEFDTIKNTKNSIWCRGSFPIYVPNKASFAAFVESAVNLELIASSLVNLQAPKVKVTLDEFDFISFPKGVWTMQVTLQSQGKSPLTVRHEYGFDVSQAAVIGCGQVTSALRPALQAMLLKLYSEPRFIEVVASPNSCPSGMVCSQADNEKNAVDESLTDRK